jgi:hypothetical protein
MGIFVPSWLVVVVIVMFIMFMCGRKRVTETLLTPFGLAPKSADMTEIAFRNQMFQ